MTRSKSAALKPGQLGARTRARLKLAGAVGWEFARQKKNGQTSAQKIADKLGVSRQRAHKVLASPGNWKIETIGDLLWAMDLELDQVTFRPSGSTIKVNYRPPAVVHADAAPAFFSRNSVEFGRGISEAKSETARVEDDRPLRRVIAE